MSNIPIGKEVSVLEMLEGKEGIGWRLKGASSSIFLMSSFIVIFKTLCYEDKLKMLKYLDMVRKDDLFMNEEIPFEQKMNSKNVEGLI